MESNWVDFKTIKRAVTIEQVLEHYSVKLRGSGKELRGPALVVWGDRDPFLPTKFAHAYGEALGGAARVEIVESAGHWPWLNRPELVDEIAAFLTGA